MAKNQRSPGDRDASVSAPQTDSPIASSEPQKRPKSSPAAITYCGGYKALLKDVGVDAQFLTDQGEGATANIAGPDGHIWHVEFTPPFVYAFRERTAEELVRWNDGVANSYISSQPSERNRYARDITREIQWMARSFSTELSSREMRRAHKKRLAALVDLQLALLLKDKRSLSEFREAAAALGVQIQQRRFDLESPNV